MMNRQDLLKGSIIALLCVALIAGIVLSVARPDQPDDDRLSAVETEPVGGNSTPTEKPTAPDEPSVPETEPGVQGPPDEAPEKQPGNRPTEPKPTEPEVNEPEATEPEEPENKVTILTGDVSVADKTVTEDASFGDGNVSVKIPAGVQLNQDTTSLTLTITEKDSSDSGVQLDAGQTMLPLDVHMAGVSAENTQPITIGLGKLLPAGMNIGNVTLYHVENGTANPMTQVFATGDLVNHNQFHYDPVTGNITVAMASFSEVAMVSTEANPWNGKFANFTGNGTEEDPYIIANADQLAEMSKLVSENNEIYGGAHYKLIANINFGGSEHVYSGTGDQYVFYPIGYWKQAAGTNSAGEIYYTSGGGFSGVFDGNGNTISGIFQNTWVMNGNYDRGYWDDAMGLFGWVRAGGTVKNLTVDNFVSEGEYTPTGCIAAYAGDATFVNISLTNCHPATYNTAVGGIVGMDASKTEEEYLTLENITVDQSNTISALWGTYDCPAGGLIGWVRGDNNTIHFENCHVAAVMDVFNDVCANYQYYWYRYCGMFIGTVQNHTNDANGYTVPNLSGITATDCTVTYGDWNEYWYCELVANSIASYTHDHQFSRLTKIASVDEIRDENGNWTKQGNFVIPAADNSSAECYHIFKDADGNLYEHKHEDEGKQTVGGEEIWVEDRQRYYMPFNQLFQGYGYGTKALYGKEELKAYPDIEITVVDGGTVQSAKKFNSTGMTSVNTGATVSVGDLFAAIVDETKISKGTVQVFVSPVGETSTVSAKYSANVSDWDKGTLTFSGSGTAKIVITDYYYCTATEVTIIVKPNEKFTANSVDAQNAYTQITLGDLFSAKDSVTGNVTATVTDPNGTEATVTGTSADWASKTIDLIKDGEWTVTIKDDDANSEKATATFTVNKVNKFVKKFDKDFLYRVGNATDSTVPIGKIFSETDTAVKLSSVKVEITNVAGNAAGTFPSDTSWTDGTIQFTGTGVVKVTISADGANPVELNLEVVDAVNATVATNAAANNVVLLNDIGSGFTVSGRYTVYGNGFTLNYTGNGQYLNNGLKQGIVTVSENGTLDNLRIKATIYPRAYMYYGSTLLGDYVQGGPSSPEGDKIRYHYQLSAIAASGNATIQNCYIYGGRTNIFVNTGDVTVKDTILECGTVANIQIQSNSSHTVTLEDVTTIQYQVNATIVDTSKVMLGAGILVGPETNDNPAIVLNGEFKQYNWVTADDESAVSDEAAQKIINAALGATAFNHTVNGKTASNLGIIYMNNYEAPVTNNTGLPYKEETISISGVDGKAYSLQGASANQIYSDYENADRSTVNGLYEPQFKYDPTLGDQYIAKTDDGDEFFYREGDTIYVMFPSGETREVDLAALVNIVKYTGQDLSLQITCKDSSGNPVTVNGGKVTLSSADTYTVTYMVTDDLFYDKDGNKVEDSHSYSWDVTVEISLKDNAVPNARFDFDANKQKMGYYKPTIGDVKQYLPFLAGLKIYDYNGQTEYLRFDGDKDFSKVASVTITGYASNKAEVEIKLTDGGVINTRFMARANSGGASTYTGSIKTKNNVIYFVNSGGTSNSASTTTSAYWYVDYYKFTGNNGVAIQSAQQTFNSSGSSVSTPSGSFGTTIKYTITYDANSGNCGQTTGYATSASAAVTLPTPGRSGYIFAGWYTAASGGNRVGGAGESYTPSANITLYAQWGKPCTVTYNANGGNCGTASEKYTGTALTLPTATRDGYWFIGWYDAPEGGNKVGDAGVTYSPAGEITLYAHWQEQVEYTVNYNANGGSCGTTSATYQGTPLTLPTPTKTGSKFLGWYTAASGGTKVGDAGATYTPTANITLYARWEKIAYEITVSTSNATVSGVTSGQTAYYGDTITFTVSYTESKNKTTTVKDASGNTVTTTGSYTFTMPASNVTISATIEAECITGDTLVTLADGTQVRVDQLTGNEMLLVWNLETGRYDFAPIVFVDQDAETEVEIITLTFSDGSEVKVIYEHGFFDYDLGKYVYLDAENAESYIGHRFVTQGDISSNTWNTATLTGVNVETKVAAAYSPVTFSHLCYYVDGVLSMPGGIEGLFNIFDVDTSTMAYDAEKKAQDIETYGLYTFEDFAGMIPEEAYYAFNGAYLKVAIGKGLLTWEEIEYLAQRYVPLM